MSLFSALIPTAYAAVNDTVATTATTATAAAPVAHQGSPWSTVIMLVVMFVIFYFLLIRPQSKRAKAQRQLLAELSKGDEVVTASGIMGKVTDIDDNSVSIEIANGVAIKMQKAAVTATLPKGTIKN
jgi:preprotein translocase subunit YajC